MLSLSCSTAAATHVHRFHSKGCLHPKTSHFGAGVAWKVWRPIGLLVIYDLPLLSYCYSVALSTAAWRRPSMRHLRRGQWRAKTGNTQSRFGLSSFHIWVRQWCQPQGFDVYVDVRSWIGRSMTTAKPQRPMQRTANEQAYRSSAHSLKLGMK